MPNGQKIIACIPVLLLVTSIAQGQVDTSRQMDDGQLERPNAIQADVYAQTFMDGRGFIQKDNVGEGNNWLNLRYGLSYKRSFKNRHAVSASVSRFSTTYYPGHDPYRFQPRDVAGRRFWHFEANYLYHLIQDERFIIKSSIGADYRYGRSDIFIRYGAFYGERIHDGYIYKDLGLSAGLEVEAKIVWHVYLSSKIEYTRYVFLYEEVHRGLDFGPPKNMLSLQLGLGYRF